MTKRKIALKDIYSQFDLLASRLETPKIIKEVMQLYKIDEVTARKFYYAWKKIYMKRSPSYEHL